MTAVATVRSSGADGASNPAARVSGSFTPSANSPLYAWCFAEAPGSNAYTVGITDSVGLSWSLVDSGGPVGSFVSRYYLWVANVGASPVPMTVSFTPTANAAVTHVLFDVTGNGVSVKARAPGSIQSTGTNIVTGSLAAAATSGNLCILCAGQNRDVANAIPTPAGWSVLSAPSTAGMYEYPAVFTKTDFTGTSVTWTPTGSTDAAAAVLFEIVEGGAAQTVIAEDGTYAAMEDGTRIEMESPRLATDPIEPKYIGAVKASTGATAALTDTIPIPLAVGDVVVVKGSSENASSAIVGASGVAAPTVAGVTTFTRLAQQGTISSSEPYGVVFVGVVTTAQAAGAAASGMVTLAGTGKSMLVEVWDGRQVALDATPQTLSVNGTGVPSQTFTTEDADSVITYVVVDFSAIMTMQALHPSWVMDEGADRALGRYCGYYAYINTPGPAGSETIAMRTPTGQDYVICAVELLRV